MTYIDNLIDAIFLVCNDLSLNGKTYWIADRRPYTTNEIYETIANILEVKNYKPRYIPGSAALLLRKIDKGLQSIGLYNQYIHIGGEMNLNIACSIERARKELGYDPKVDLEEGIELSILWCKRNKLL